MDTNLVEKINEYAMELTKEENPKLLKELRVLLKLLEYQSWLLKYKLRVIENPEEEDKSPLLLKHLHKFGHKNAFSKDDLTIPLLIYLFTHNHENKKALETSLSFMENCKDFLKEGDFAKTKTGVQRFITNTRFASLELRNYGLLRSDSKHYFHTWKLSLFGILIAGSIYFDFQNDLAISFLNKKFNTQVSSWKFQQIIFNHINELQNERKFDLILFKILEDQIVGEYMDLYRNEFLRFAKIVNLVIENRYDVKKDSTKKLISLLNGINENKEISRLANSIVLKKNIDVNMKNVFEIIDENKKPTDTFWDNSL